MEYYSFEDVKREYMNHYSDRQGRVLANDLSQFLAKMTTVIISALVDTPEGRELMDDAIGYAADNAWTQEQWADFKPKLIVFLFHLLLMECPVLKHELALHLYDELRKDDTHDE